MANEEQLSILKQGVEVWNKWRQNHSETSVDLRGIGANEGWGDLNAERPWAFSLPKVDLHRAHLRGANLGGADMRGANLSGARLIEANLRHTDLRRANLTRTDLWATNLSGTDLREANLSEAKLQFTIFGNSDLSKTYGLEKVVHVGPSTIGINTIQLSKGALSEVFLRGCGLSDIDIEYSKLYNPDLSNEERSKILYRVYDLQAGQSIQISPLFISYSRADSVFVDKVETQLNAKGIRFWRDIHGMNAGRMETQVDRAIRQNPTVLLVLSQNSLKSDWVEHEVRAARGLEKEIGRDVLCPIALDDSWKCSPWPKRVMEQIMEYNILDFSEWKDDSKFDRMFHKLIDGLELFYKR